MVILATVMVASLAEVRVAMIAGSTHGQLRSRGVAVSLVPGEALAGTAAVTMISTESSALALLRTSRGVMRGVRVRLFKALWWR